MANIGIDSASAYVPTEKRNNIYLTSAVINYAASASWKNQNISADPPATGAGGSGQEITWYTFSYSSLSYSWNLGGVSSNTANGSVIVGNLTSGQINNITCTVIVSGEETITTHHRTDWHYIGYDESLYPGPEPELDEDDPLSIEEHTHWQAAYNNYIASYYNYWQAGEATSSESTTTKTATYTITVLAYTRPGNFTDYNFSTDTIIQSPDGLTATKVSNWISHCNKYAHWYNQNGNDTISNNSSCYVSPGDIITAAWYNACISAIPGLTNTQYNNYVDDSPPGYNVRGGANGTIITADIINLLGELISIT